MIFADKSSRVQFHVYWPLLPLVPSLDIVKLRFVKDCWQLCSPVSSLLVVKTWCRLTNFTFHDRLNPELVSRTDIQHQHDMVLCASTSTSFMFCGQQAKCIFRISEHQIAPIAESAASGKVPSLVLVIRYFMMDSKRGLQSTANQQHLEPLKSPHKTFIVHETFHHWLILL